MIRVRNKNVDFSQKVEKTFGKNLENQMLGSPKVRRLVKLMDEGIRKRHADTNNGCAGIERSTWNEKSQPIKAETQ